MRPSYRLILPALTILTWSIEASYASYPSPAQDIYKRQVRTADYATASRPNNGLTPPAAEPPSASRSASEPAQPSDKPKTKRSSLADAHSQVLESFDRVDSGARRPTSRIHRNSRADNDAYYYRQGSKRGKNDRKMDSSHPQRKDRNHGHDRGVESHALKERGEQYGGGKGVKLHSLKERKGRNISRQSGSTDLDTLHIARRNPGVPSAPGVPSGSGVPNGIEIRPPSKPGTRQSPPKTGNSPPALGGTSSGKPASSSPDITKAIDTSKVIDTSKAGNPTNPDQVGVTIYPTKNMPVG